VVAKHGDEAWQSRAACRGPHAGIFFPPSHVERKEERLNRERTAKAICHSCPVEGDCLDYAIRIREAHGIWGGRNESERKHILDRLPTAAALRMHA